MQTGTEKLIELLQRSATTNMLLWKHDRYKYGMFDIYPRTWNTSIKVHFETRALIWRAQEEGIGMGLYTNLMANLHRQGLISKPKSLYRYEHVFWVVTEKGIEAFKLQSVVDQINQKSDLLFQKEQGERLAAERFVTKFNNELEQLQQKLLELIENGTLNSQAMSYVNVPTKIVIKEPPPNSKGHFRVDWIANPLILRKSCKLPYFVTKEGFQE